MVLDPSKGQGDRSVTEKTIKRSEFLLREATKIAREARESRKLGDHERVIRKTQEALELWMKGKLLQQGVEPAKIHDLNELDRKLLVPSGIDEDDLLFTAQRIPAFYGADDLIPDETYTDNDSGRCVAALEKVGI